MTSSFRASSLLGLIAAGVAVSHQACAEATVITPASWLGLENQQPLIFGSHHRPGLAGNRTALALQTAISFMRDGHPVLLAHAKKPRVKRRTERLVHRQLECKVWKYHGADRLDRPYNPDRFVYTAEYKRNPDRPQRQEMAKIAEERFPQMVNGKILRMLELVNLVRARRGHTTMKLEPRLMIAAKRHNLDIARYALMQHTGTDCSQLVDRVWDVGYTWTKIAENLAGGNKSAVATVRQWTGSSRHLMQMTLPNMTDAGIAYDYNPNPPRSGIPIKHFWTLILARPDPWRDRRWIHADK